MPGKPGRSGRPRKDPRPPPDTDDSNNEQADNELPQQQLATSAVSNLHTRQRGRPKRCKLAEDDDISTTSLVESDNQSESLSTTSDQPSQSDLKLHPKTSTENLKDQIIGAPVDRFNTSKLPVKKLVCQRYRSLRNNSTMNNKGLTNKDLADVISNEILYIWQLANLPTKRKDHVKQKVLETINEISGLFKYGSSRLQLDKDPCKSFIESLDYLFDISVDNLREQLSTRSNRKAWKEDYAFYQSQCLVPQVGCMAGLDKHMQEQETRSKQRVADEQARLEREKAERLERHQKVKSSVIGTASETPQPGTSSSTTDENLPKTRRHLSVKDYRDLW